MVNDPAIIKREELEKLLVRQFKLLKDMIALTDKERLTLLNDPENVLSVVEEKEALLDSMTLMEDHCRNVVQELSLLLEIHSDHTSIEALLPLLKPETASRIRHLTEGISSLAGRARELNRANQAVALTKLEWLKATQLFLIGLFQPDTGYQPPKGGGTNHQDAAGLGVEYRV